MVRINKTIATLLNVKAQEVAHNFSNKDRQYNYNNETFILEYIKPLSEYTAIVVYKKDTGKKSLAFFYYINYNNGKWCYFYPKESHIFGICKLPKYLQMIEEHNFNYNGV